MKIAIALSENKENIGVVKDYTDINNKGEISHFLMELEIIKMELMELWEEYSENEV